MKNSFVAIMAFTLAMLVVPAQASVQITEPNVETFATSQLPSFIPDNPVALTEQDMKEVRGEFVPLLAYYAVMYGVPYSIALAVMVSRSGVPLIRIAFDAVVEWRSR